MKKPQDGVLFIVVESKLEVYDATTLLVHLFLTVAMSFMMHFLIVNAPLRCVLLLIVK